jgi:hypothetical protein
MKNICQIIIQQVKTDPQTIKRQFILIVSIPEKIPL